MNLDFHYYGTYCAARIAEFSHEQAGKIAWAAQTVDECTEDYLNAAKIPAANQVITCETNTENLKDNIYDLSAFNSETLLKLRKIWMPFHFLPGNLDNHLNIKDPVLKNQRNYPDLQCICTHNSTMVSKIISDTINKFASANPLSDKILYLTGIRMHVLADTFAHEFFAGTPSYFINDVGNSGFKILKKDTSLSDYVSTPAGVSNYSVFYLGHGRLGHLPDDGSMSYEYHPHWSMEGYRVIRCNAEIFAQAFYEMIDALKCIRKHASFEPADTYLDGENALFQELKNPIKWGNLKNVLKSKTGDEACRAWCQYMKKMDFPDLQNYNKKQASPTAINDFLDAARAHQDMVCAELQAANIPAI
nr:DUF6765 family protein [uncultured Clostridium sp.]